MRTVGYEDKSFPAHSAARPIDQLGLTLPEFATPLLALDEQALDNNLVTMAAWVAERGLELMPHGKTTMAPTLWRRQLDAGATGISVATAWQALIALHHGVGTVQIANSCLDPTGLRDIVAWLDAHPDQEVICWVDSEAAVQEMERVLPDGSPIGVLVELGAPGARTGERSLDGALNLAHRIASSPAISLRGVAGYEGALAHDRSPDALAAVASYCRSVAALLAATKDLIPRTPWITLGGSAYFDVVADSLADVTNARRVLRSGAYLLHDDGFYRGISPLDSGRVDELTRPLQAAMLMFARVISQPEPGLALLDAGKRDMSFDEGLPLVRAVSGRLGGPERPLAAEVTALNDQHTFLRWPAAQESPVRVGEVVRLGLSHPCTALDKWRLLPLLNPATGRIDEAVETFF